MKVLVTGVCGQLGHDVMNELAKRNIDGIGSDIHEHYQGISDNTAVCFMPYISMDITNSAVVNKVIDEIRPEAVIHCAAWTAVDAAEDIENQNKVYSINVTGTRNIAEACNRIDAKLLYLSTDYVFDGQGDSPWLPDYKGYKPLNYYGKTKFPYQRV